ncbi:MAG: long-chain fatty acid--CoA ligase [Acidobacteriota bacterium]|nr:long-chain fatty acid--CoA ligase [Acidobacteriota bacterium]
MEAQTLNQLFAAACARHNKEDAILHKESGEWKKFSSAAWLDAARDAAVGLSLRGVQKGDRVVLLSENRVEWFTIEAGLQILGAVTVPIYPTLTAQQAAYIIRDSGARVVIASSAEQQAKIAAVRDSLSSVEMVFTLDAPVEGSGDQSWSRVTDAGRSSRAVDSGAAERLAAAVSGDDLATIIYTSGTTGNPKGVMLTQANLVQNTLVAHEALTLTPEDRAISVLPYSHVFARMVAHYLYPHAGVTIAIAESMDTLVENIGEVHPTVMACVPRFYEKMRDKVLESAAAGSPLKQKIFNWAFSVGYAVGQHRQDGTSVPAGLKFKYGLATKLVFSKLHARMGGRMELFVSGGAALPRDVAEFFLAAGWVVIEGYGLTETSPVITVNRRERFRFGTVGIPVRGVDVKIADDGEILCRGHNVMKGYFGNEAATDEAIVDGWFHTGDVGAFDEDGFLRITDRKKDLLVTAGGKNVAPQPIEGSLKSSVYIAELVMVGDGKPYLSALVAPDFEQLGRWCEGEGIPADSPETMAADERVQAHLMAEIGRLSEGLASFEQVKKIAVVTAAFTIESGELTPTMKVKRRVVAERYADLIESLYG